MAGSGGSNLAMSGAVESLSIMSTNRRSLGLVRYSYISWYHLIQININSHHSGAGDDFGHVACVAVVRAPAGAVLARLPDAVNHRVKAVAALLKFPH